MILAMTRALALLPALLALATLSANAQEPDVANPPPEENGAATEAAEADGSEGASPVIEVVHPLVAEQRELIEAIVTAQARLDGLDAQLDALRGEERLVQLGQIGRIEIDILKRVDRLIANAEKSREGGLPTTEADVFLADELPLITPYLIELISQSQLAVLEISATRAEISQSQLLPFEERLADLNGRVDRYYEVLLEHAVRMERVDLEGSEAREYVRTELGVRADRIAGRLELARKQIATLEERVRNSPDDAGASLELLAAKAKLDWSVASLKKGVRSLDSLDVPTAQYRQLLIRATGSITEDVLDVEVAQGLLGEAFGEVSEWFQDNGPTVAFRLMLFLVIVLAARMLGGLAGSFVRRALGASRLHTSAVLQDMLAVLTRRAILLLGILFGLSQIGIQIGPLLAGLGILGFAVGFALQNTLSNFAAGTMLLLYRPFDAGDVVEAGGVLGTVDNLSLVNTTLLTFDNRQIVVPNNKIWGDIITNITAMKIRRVDLEVGVDYSEPVDRVEALLLDVVNAHPHVLADPAPIVKVHKLDEASVDFVVRPWTLREHYWDVYWDLNQAIKRRFEEQHVEFARRRRHVVIEPAAEPAGRDEA